MPVSVIQTDSAALHLEVRGDGPPIVLLHGGPGAYDYLSGSALGSWLARTHTVVGYDQRGCRRSTSTGPFTVKANLCDVEAVRRHLGVEQMVLVGHSWGGLLALFYAAAYPRGVAALVLIGPIGPRQGWDTVFWSALEDRHTTGQRRALARIDEQIAHTRDRRCREELYHQRFNVALASFLAPAHRGTDLEMESYSRQVSVTVMASVHLSRYADPSWERGLAELRAPVTILHGRDDPVPWSVVNDLRQIVPAAKVIPLDDCGHFPWLEIPDRFEPAIVEVLDGLSW